MKTFLPVLIVLTIADLSHPTTTRADTFGTAANTFTIDFVGIGNAGNANDAWGFGGVPYIYHMAEIDVSQAMIDAARNLGVANLGGGAWSGNKPAASMNWYQAAAFVNWLNTSTGHQAAYNVTCNGGNWSMALWSPAEAWQLGGQNLFRNANAYYFLPSENEWYKAAYYDPNKGGSGVGGYWFYATGSDTAPTAVASGTAVATAVYNSVASVPAAVDQAGGLSPYGTRGQTGNVWQWIESTYDGQNANVLAYRTIRGGSWHNGVGSLGASQRGAGGNPPDTIDFGIGFRVAHVADSDGDGIPDQYETGTGVYVSPTNTGTSPTNPDTDGDGLTDGQEVNIYHSNPHLADTDGDDFSDGFEVATGFDPTSAASTPDAQSSIRIAAEYRFNAANGISYRIETSTDLTNWSTIEANIIGTGGTITRFYSIEGQPRRYFRSRRN